MNKISYRIFIKLLPFLLGMFFLSLPSYGASLRVNVKAKGTGSVTVTLNGQSKQYSFSHASSTWGAPTSTSSLDVYVGDNVVYNATVSSSGVGDYVVYVGHNPNSRQPISGDEVLLNQKRVAGVSKAEIAGGVFTVCSEKRFLLPFGELDESQLATTGKLKFGFGGAGNMYSNGVLLCGVSSSIDWIISKGPTNPDVVDQSARKQIYTDEGLVDVDLSNASQPIVKFYRGVYSKSGTYYSVGAASPVATYTISSYVPSSSYAAPSPNMSNTSKRHVTLTRVIDGQTYLLEYRVDGYYRTSETYTEHYWYDGYPLWWYELLTENWYASATRIWKWRKFGSPLPPLEKRVANSYYSDYYNDATGQTVAGYGPPWLKTYVFSGSDDTSALVDYRGESYELGDDGMEGQPRAISVGSDDQLSPLYRRIYSYSQGSVSGVSGTKLTDENGGEQFTETYKHATLGSQPYSAIRLPKTRRRSNLDNAVGGAADLIEEIQYVEVIPNVVVKPSSNITKQGSITIEKATRSYSYGNSSYFDNKEVITETINNYLANGTYLVSKKKYFSGRNNDPLFRDKVISVEGPDGSKTSILWERGAWTGSAWTKSSTGRFLRKVELTGKVGTGVTSFAGSSIEPLTMESLTHASYLLSRSTATETIKNMRGQPVYKADYAYAATGFVKMNETKYEYDSYANLTKISDGVGGARILYEASYLGRLKSWERNEAGVKSIFTYDNYERLTEIKVEGYGGTPEVITSFTYDGAGRVVGKKVGSGNNELTTTTTYDTSNRIISTTDAAGVATTFAYDNSANRVTKTVASGAGGFTEVSDIFKDGGLKSVSGTAVPDRTYSYSYLSNGQLEVGETFSSGKWTKTVRDWNGRVDRTLEPTKAGGIRYTYNFYNSVGQLYKQEYKNSSGTHLLPRSLYNYDTYGRLEYQGSDSNMNGVLDLGSDANVLRHGFHFQRMNSDPENAWYLYEVTFGFPYEGSNASAQKVLNQSYVQVGGFSATRLSRTMGYDAQRNFTSSTTAVDRATRTATTTSEVPGSGDNTIETNVNGFTTSVKNAQGHTFQYGYDSAGRLISEIDPRLGSANSVEYVYKTDSSQIDTVENTDGTKVVYGYYTSGRLYSQTVHPSSAGLTPQTTYYAYNAAGNVVATWGNGATPSFNVFNDLGQQTELQTFRSEPTWNGTAFNIVGDKTAWTYHGATGLLTSKKDAANKSTIYDYDDLNRVKTRTDARNVVTTYAYYDYTYYSSSQFTGALRQQSFSSVAGVATSPTVSYVHHRNGGLKQVTDAANIRSFEYYESWSSGNADLGKSALLKKETLGAFYYNKPIELDYHFGSSSHVNGLPKSFQMESASVYKVATDYSDKNRLKTVTPSHQAAIPFAYTYLANANLVDRVDRDDNVAGAAYEYHRNYDYASKSNRLTRVLTDWNGSNATDAQPTYDSFGRLDIINITGNVITGLGTGDYGSYGLKEYQKYTDRNEIDYSVKHQRDSAGGFGAGVKLNGANNFYRNYDYDAIGNRTLEEEHQQQNTTTRNNLNQYTVYAGLSQTHDLNGNLTNDGRFSYVYDSENRLVEVTPLNPVSGSLKVINTYDYLGRRVQKEVRQHNGSTWNTGFVFDRTRRYVYDGWNLIAEIDRNGVIRMKYTWGNDVSATAQGAGGVGGLLMVEFLHDGVSYPLYPIYDQAHNIRGLHDAAGATVARYDYDTFGESFKMNGAYATINPFRFSTKFTDDETGLIYYGLRFYDPEAGRFVNRDPIGESGGLNLYGFVGNNPANRYDYLGMNEVELERWVFEPWYEIMGYTDPNQYWIDYGTHRQAEAGRAGLMGHYADGIWTRVPSSASFGDSGMGIVGGLKGLVRRMMGYEVDPWLEGDLETFDLEPYEVRSDNRFHSDYPLLAQNGDGLVPGALTPNRGNAADALRNYLDLLREVSQEDLERLGAEKIRREREARDFQLETQGGFRGIYVAEYAGHLAIRDSTWTYYKNPFLVDAISGEAPDTFRGSLVAYLWTKQSVLGPHNAVFDVTKLQNIVTLPSGTVTNFYIEFLGEN